MKLALLAVMAAVVLTGCDAVVGGPKADMVAVCRNAGESHQKCTCIANTMQERLDPETFDKMAVAVISGDDAVAEALAGLEPDQAENAILAIADASLSCI